MHGTSMFGITLERNLVLVLALGLVFPFWSLRNRLVSYYCRWGSVKSRHACTQYGRMDRMAYGETYACRKRRLV